MRDKCRHCAGAMSTNLPSPGCTALSTRMSQNRARALTRANSRPSARRPARARARAHRGQHIHSGTSIELPEPSHTASTANQSSPKLEKRVPRSCAPSPASTTPPPRDIPTVPALNTRGREHDEDERDTTDGSYTCKKAIEEEACADEIAQSKLLRLVLETSDRLQGYI